MMHGFPLVEGRAAQVCWNTPTGEETLSQVGAASCPCSQWPGTAARGAQAIWKLTARVLSSVLQNVFSQKGMC